MKVWAVWDGDYDGEWIAAAYSSETLAQEHARRTGQTDVREVEVLSSVDVPDTTVEREAKSEARRAEYQKRQSQEKSSHERTMALKIADFRNPSLCHCATFHTGPYSLITPNGYCQYCGCWTPEVYRAHLGEKALRKAINLLSEWDRVKMRKVLGLQTKKELRQEAREKRCEAGEHSFSKWSAWELVSPRCWNRGRVCLGRCGMVRIAMKVSDSALVGAAGR